MAITRYAGDRFTTNTSDTKPTGVLDGAYLIDTGNLTQYVRRTVGGTSQWSQLAGGGGGGTPGGANTQVQFNNAGAFGGNANLTFDGSKLAVNDLALSGIIYDSNNSIGNGGMVLTNEGTTGVNWKSIESVLSGVGGSGVANYVARWSDEDTITTGALYDDGGSVGVGTTVLGEALTVNGKVEADEFLGELRGPVVFGAKAAEALVKGEAVYISGISGNTTVVAKACANETGKMPVFGLAHETVNANTFVEVTTFGTLSNINTSSFLEGDELFVGITAGALVNSPPTGEAAQIQKIAKVTRSDATVGSVKVMGAGRSNATPNLNEGRLFVGNSSNQAVADGTIHVDIANSKVGIGTNAPDVKLHLYGAGSPQFRIQDSTNNCILKAYAQDSDAFIGTHSNHDFNIGANNATHVTVKAGGSVGIGTNNPGYPLTVANGVTQARVDLTLQYLNNIDSLTNTDLGRVLFRAPYSGTGNNVGSITLRTGASPYRTDLRFKVKATGGSERQGIIIHGTSDGALVGIGQLTDPTFPFQVSASNLENGPAKRIALFFDETNAAAGTGAGIALGGYVGAGTDPGVSAINDFGVIQGIKENSTLGNYASAMLFLTRQNSANPAEQMRINSEGNVGIGTTNPEAKIRVSNSAASGGTFKFTDGSSRTLMDLGGGILSWNAGSVLGAGSWAGTADHQLQTLGTTRDTVLINGPASGTNHALYVTGLKSYFAGNVGIGNILSQAHTNENTSTVKLRVGSDTLTSNQSSAIQIGGYDSSGSGTLGAIEFFNHRDDSIAAKIQVRRDLESPTKLSAGQIDFYTDDGDNNLDVHMSIDALGRVGIGTVSPSETLEINHSNHEPVLIKSTGNYNSMITMDSNRSSANSYVGGLAGKWNGTQVASIYLRTGSDTTNKDDGYITLLTASSGTLVERMRIQSDGNVGIGTTTPLVPLDVRGNITLDKRTQSLGSAELAVKSSVHSSIVADRNANTNSANFMLRTAGTNKWRMSLGMAGSSNEKFSIYDEANTKNVLTVEPGGNIGIGDNLVDPEHRFHVSGDAIISGYLYDSTNSTGVDGYVLTSKENGPQWKMIEDVLSGVGGNGTANYIPKWEDEDTIGDSVIAQSGTAIGIGTAAPATSLEVLAADPVLTVRDTEATVASASATLRLAESSATNTLNGHFDLKFAGSASGGDLDISRYNNTSLVAQGVRIKHDGNVGIGTNSPQGKLDINTEAAQATHVYINGEVNQDKLLYFRHYANSEGAGNNAYVGYIGSKGVDNLLSLGHLNTSGTDVSIMHLTEAGNVGIGTTNPATKLYVGSGTQSVANLAGIAIGNGASSYSYFSASDQTKQYIAGVDHSITYTKAGNVSNHDHSIVTNNTTRIYILAGGNVGIGTVTPKEKLHVNNGSNAGAGPVYPLRLSGGGEMSTAGDATGILFVQRDTNNDYGSYIRLTTTQTTPSYLNPRLEFGVQNNNTNVLGSVSTKMVITGSGSVGIGTTTPGKLLELVGGGLRLPNGESIDWNNENTRILGSHNSNKIQFDVGGVSNVLYLSNGSVGIGTTGPAAPLNVNGGAVIGGITRFTAGGTNELSVNLAVSECVGFGASNSAFTYFRRYSASIETFQIQPVHSGTNNGIISMVPYGGQVHIGMGNGTAAKSLLTISGNSDDGDDACALRIIDEDDTVGSKLPAIMFYGGSTIQGRIRGGDGTFSIAVGSTPTTAFSINTTSRKIAFGSYGSGTHTGTAAYRLMVDSSGNVIEGNLGAGVVDGSGTANYITKWTDTDTIGNSILQDLGYLYQTYSENNSTTWWTDSSSGFVIHNTNTTVGAGPSLKLRGADARITYGENSTNRDTLTFTSRKTEGTAGQEIVFDSDGNVGIGTTAPGQKLHVNGSAEIDGSIYINDTNTRIFEGSGNSVRLETNSGYIDVGPQNATYAHLQTDRDRFYFNRELVVDSGIIRSYNEDLQFDASYSGAVAKNIIFRTGNVEKMRMDTAGSFGIGTNGPAAKLDVSGNILRSGLTYSSWTSRSINSITSGSSTINYILIAPKTSTNVRLSGRFNCARGSAVSAVSIAHADIVFCTDNDANPQSGGIHSASSDIPTYGHANFEIVELEYSLTEYYALKISPSSSWTASFDHIEFEGIANNITWTNIDSGNVSNVGAFGGNQAVFAYKHANVGIGTDSPAARLHITSDGSHDEGAEIVLRHANNNSTDVVSTLSFQNNGGQVAMIQGGTTSGNNNGYISFFTDNAGTSGERMRITSNGNVTIGNGTQIPYNKLHVYGTGRINSLMVGNAAASNVPATALHIKSSGTDAVLRIEDSDSSNQVFDLLVDQGVGFQIIDKGSTGSGTDTRLTIDTAGNVGIGSTQPGVALDVSGKLSIGSPNASYDLYNNGTTYLNGNVTVDATLSVTGGVAGVSVINSSTTDSAAADSYLNIFKTAGSGGGSRATLRVGYDATACFQISRIRNDANIYINSRQSGSAMVFQIQDTEKMNLTSSALTLVSGHQLRWGDSSTYITGSNSSDFLQFYPNGSVQLTLNSSGATIENDLIVDGNIGIGTATANAKLHAYLTGSAGSFSNIGLFRAGPDSNDSGAEIFVGQQGNSRGLVIRGGRGTGDQALAHFYLNQSGGVIPSATQDHVMTFLQGGYVGIGTTSPAASLQIGNSTSNQPSDVAVISADGGNAVLNALSLVNSRTAALGNGTAISFHNASNYSPTGKIETVQAGDTTTDSELRFYTYGPSSLQQQMVINHDGNVGIGTTNPGTYKLNVNGPTMLDGYAYIDDYLIVDGNIHFETIGQYISFYGDNSRNHSIVANNSLGNAADDLRINTYGALYINLDSNNNNTSGADFSIGRHGGTGTLSDWLLDLSGETGQLQLNKYGSGTHTGTAAYRLMVDSSGNVIEGNLGSGVVDGSGTANYITRWTDTDTIGNSNIFDNGTIGIGTAANLNGKVTIRAEGNSVGDHHIFCQLSAAAVDHGASIFLKTSINTDNNRYGARIRAIRNANNNAAADLAFSLENTGATALAEVVRFTSDGCVGIGITNPSSKLYVDGTTHLQGDTGIGIGPSSSYRLSVEGTNNTPARILSTVTSLNLTLGNTTQTYYTDVVLNSNSGNAQVWKAGSTYTAFGGASSLNIYCSNGKIAFHPSANANKVVIQSDGDVDIAENLGVGGAHSGTYVLYVHGDGYMTGNLGLGGTLTEASSLAIKENIETFEPSLDIINKIRPVKYDKKTTGKKEIGLIAEELAELFPELVEKDKNGNPSGVNYSRAVTVLLGGFKELYKEVQELKKRI